MNSTENALNDPMRTRLTHSAGEFVQSPQALLKRVSPSLLLLASWLFHPDVTRAGQPSENATKPSPAAVFARAEQHLADRDRLAQSLIAVAKDRSAPATDREQAIAWLARLRSESGRRFMLNNLSMRIPLAITNTSELQGRQQPCLFYLTDGDYLDWSTGRTLLRMLDEEIPQSELVWFPGVLSRIFRMDPRVLKPMLEYEWKQATNETRKRHLEYILDKIGR